MGRSFCEKGRPCSGRWSKTGARTRVEGENGRARVCQASTPVARMVALVASCELGAGRRQVEARAGRPAPPGAEAEASSSVRISAASRPPQAPSPVSSPAAATRAARLNDGAPFYRPARLPCATTIAFGINVDRARSCSSPASPASLVLSSQEHKVAKHDLGHASLAAASQTSFGRLPPALSWPRREADA